MPTKANWRLTSVSATTFFKRKLEENPDFFCLVENQDLTLKFTKSWADFYNALLRRVAVKELNKSSLLVKRYIKRLLSSNSPSQIIWTFKPDVRTHPIMTGEKSGESSQIRAGSGIQFGKRSRKIFAVNILESHRVHKEAYAYPVVLKLKWD